MKRNVDVMYHTALRRYTAKLTGNCARLTCCVCVSAYSVMSVILATSPAKVTTSRNPRAQSTRNIHEKKAKLLSSGSNNRARKIEMGPSVLPNWKISIGKLATSAVAFVDMSTMRCPRSGATYVFVNVIVALRSAGHAESNCTSRHVSSIDCGDATTSWDRMAAATVLLRRNGIIAAIAIEVHCLLNDVRLKIPWATWLAPTSGHRMLPPTVSKFKSAHSCGTGSSKNMPSSILKYESCAATLRHRLCRNVENIACTTRLKPWGHGMWNASMDPNGPSAVWTSRNVAGNGLTRVPFTSKSDSMEVLAKRCDALDRTRLAPATSLALNGATAAKSLASAQ
ncbi:hypothetical protein H310_08745 [Aphanomyces invadans]|uniref:Uncharacterized protein n=1 Tax=Aphanomyces invadans TaxID=157072 RepID=A0A024TXB6_9STRA|nr:hypothetical protein H310_08745 [Aphanomyces invadans]ETV98629.1 hypothetical protein H310_08745 [Aphanomyces invadans]|eukprot:XP_008872826.1 hypothetical protein H310_08745 [Aphanomyces invadans]